MVTSIIILRLCLYARQTTIFFSTYSCERLNFPTLAKIRSYLVTFVRVKGYSFLDGSLLGQRTYLVKKIVFIEPQVTFAIPAKEQFAGACAILVVCQ